MALHLFLYVFFKCFKFELGGVAVVHCLPEKKKKCSVSEFTNISGMVELKQYSMEFVVPIKNDYHFICKHA